MHTGTDVTSDEIMEMYCEPCKRDGTRNLLAEGFCVKCEDFICGTCVLYHKRFFSDHNIKSRQEMSFEFDTGKCSEHTEEPVMFYCERCDDFACAICKQNCHRNCSLIKHLYEVAEAFEMGEGNDIVSKISILKCEANNVRQNIAENTELARKFKETVKTDVKQRKIELIAEFDQIENEIDTIESTDQDRLQNCAKAVDKLDAKLTLCQSEIESTERKSKYKMFMDCKRATKSMDKLKIDLESIQKSLFVTKYNYTASKIGAGMLQNQTVQRTAVLIKTKLAGLLAIILELLVGLYGLGVIFSLHIGMYLYMFLNNHIPLQKIKYFTSHCHRYVCIVAGKIILFIGLHGETIGCFTIAIAVVVIVVSFVPVMKIYEYVCIIAGKIVLFIGLHGETIAIIGWFTIAIALLSSLFVLFLL